MRLEDFTRGLGEQLPVGAPVVGRRGHRRQIRLAFGGADGYARQLAIGNLNPIAGHGLFHLPDVIGADLVTQSPRAGVDHDADPALRQTHLAATVVS